MRSCIPIVGTSIPLLSFGFHLREGNSPRIQAKWKVLAVLEETFPTLRQNFFARSPIDKTPYLPLSAGE
jgi:hypothetical protein